ncbi:MAG: hypothetical protein IJO52_11600, partial [Clostridia bacterium]|nr:hypothetical protein [Clostridia bacterium]
TEGEKLLLERLLRGVMYEKTACEGKPHCRYTLNDLWQYGISGDVPIVSMKVRDSEALTDCTAVIKLHRLCVLCGVHFDLVFLIRETELYGCPLENGLGALIKRFGSGYLVGKKGGIFLLSADKGDIIDSVSRLCVNDALPQSEPLSPLSVCTLPDKSCHSDTPPSVLSTHGGDFTAMGFTVDKVDRCPPLAYSHVLSNLAFGSVITHNSLGYSWFSNSHERRLTRFENNAYDSFVSEKVYIAREGVLYDLCAMATSVQYLPNLAIYRGRAADTDYTLEVTLHARLFIKLVRVTLSHRQRVIYAAVPHFTRALHLERTEDGIIFRSPFATEGGIITSRGGKPAFSLYEAMGHSCTLRDTAAVYCEGESMSFALCAVTERSLEYTKNAALNADFDKIYAETRKFTLEMLGKDVRDSHVGEDGISVMRNFWLPYQAIFCRFFARGALYQSGGAYGLRDQLQDCRIFFGDNPRFARRHIIRCAAHQFEEGDAQHWWHNIRRHDGFNAGIRSRCSDDYLWLVWVCCEYAEATGDEGIWDVQVRYLSDAPLERSEHERYSVPAFSEVKESIFHHCLRAIRLFEARGVGAHGLALMGSCDWNDGMSAVGIGGKGESVWLSLFARIVLEMFGELCKKRGEPYKEWLTLSDRLGESIDRSAWNGKWFMRGFYDDGSPLGDDSRDECKIDILPQAFSAMADAFLAKKRPDAYRSDRKMITSALDYAYKMLYDRENR